MAGCFCGPGHQSTQQPSRTRCGERMGGAGRPQGAGEGERPAWLESQHPPGTPGAFSGATASASTFAAGEDGRGLPCAHPPRSPSPRRGPGGLSSAGRGSARLSCVAHWGRIPLHRLGRTPARQQEARWPPQVGRHGPRRRGRLLPLGCRSGAEAGPGRAGRARAPGCAQVGCPPPSSSATIYLGIAVAGKSWSGHRRHPFAPSGGALGLGGWGRPGDHAL